MHPSVHYSIIHSTLAKTGKQPKRPSTDEHVEEDVTCVHTYAQWNTARHKEERDFAICSNIDGLAGSSVVL